MPSITEGQLTFQFPGDWKASKFDEWSFYRNQFQSVCGGAKAVDVLAVEPRTCSWKIEVKDYRQHRRTKTIDLAEEVAVKVRDSLAALVAASANANARRRDRCHAIGVAAQRRGPAFGQTTQALFARGLSASVPAPA